MFDLLFGNKAVLVPAIIVIAVLIICILGYRIPLSPPK